MVPKLGLMVNRGKGQAGLEVRRNGKEKEKKSQSRVIDTLCTHCRKENSSLACHLSIEDVTVIVWWGKVGGEGG